MKHVISVILFLLVLQLSAQTTTVMFYNVENLFDTVDDPLKNDDEFLPGSYKHWNEKRYWIKLNNLSKVIVAADTHNAPDFVGLAEVENSTVMEDFTKRASIRKVGYEYLITDSPDARGIDVALMYKERSFRLIGHENLTVSLLPYSKGTTRQVLHAWGRIISGDTLHLYVTHWPSRINGAKATEPLRKCAAQVIRNSVNQVLESYRKPYIIIMGDFNETPHEAAVRETLNACPLDKVTQNNNLKDSVLVSLMDNADGSYCYQGDWEQIDQFVVSASFLNERGVLNMESFNVFDADFLLEPDKVYGGKHPKRTYNGAKYNGSGFSDHLPIVLTFDNGTL